MYWIFANISNGKQRIKINVFIHIFRNLMSKKGIANWATCADRATMYVYSNCSDFLQDDITVANQLLGAQWNRSWRNTVQIDCGHSPFWHEGAKSRSHNAYTSEPIQCTHTYCAYTHCAHSRDILEPSVQGSDIVTKYLPAYFGDR